MTTTLEAPPAPAPESSGHSGGGSPPTGVGAGGTTGGGSAFSEFNSAAQDFNASLGQVMGGWMSALTKADVDRQVAWAKLLVELFQPDKNGQVPTVAMKAALDFGGGPSGGSGTQSSVAISFPVGLAIMGEQFAAESAKLEMDMKVSASALDTSSLQAQASGSGSAQIGFGPFSAKISISASMSTSKESKRQSDYSSTTHAELVMGRVQTPEPVRVALDAWTELVHVQGEIAKAQMINAATKQAQTDKLLPPS